MCWLANYKMEREGIEIIEEEYGGFTYRIQDDGDLLIPDFYIAPEYRDQKYAWRLLETILQIAKQHQCPNVIGMVAIKDKHIERSLQMLWKAGFIIYGADMHLIYLIRPVT